MDQQNIKVRIVTAASLFDGHDAAINIMRRILQSKGAEIIHLGHNRSVHEIVECAIEEDAHAIAITSYQGGHVEFFKYMKDLLEEAQCGHIKIFGGGGGTILPHEIEELHAYGITRIYSPDDGRHMGLEGMIEDVMKKSGPHPASPEEKPTPNPSRKEGDGENSYLEASNNWNDNAPLGETKDIRKIARAITLAELGINYDDSLKLPPSGGGGAVLGITGTGGAGKSSVTDEFVRRFLNTYTDKTIAVISVDPSRKKTGGALLGDRIRMNAISHPRAYMRSMATRDDNTALSKTAKQAIDICKQAGFDLVILESAGVGQSDASIIDFCDVSMYVMTPEYGAASQLEKINMLDYADVICLNKFDKAGALDALHDVKKQYKRNHLLWDAKDEDLPVVGTIAAQFNDAGVNELFERIMEKIAPQPPEGGIKEVGPHFLKEKSVDKTPFPPGEAGRGPQIIPPRRNRYLSEIADTIREYDQWVEKQSRIASQLYQLNGTIELLKSEK